MASDTLPDRRIELIVANSVITILSTAFAIWRLIVRFKLAISSWRHGISDYLMFVAVVSVMSPKILSNCSMLLYNTRNACFYSTLTSHYSVLECHGQYLSSILYEGRARTSRCRPVLDSRAQERTFASHIRISGLFSEQQKALTPLQDIVFRS